jgi:hypothetical protein
MHDEASGMVMVICPSILTCVPLYQHVDISRCILIIDGGIDGIVPTNNHHHRRRRRHCQQAKSKRIDGKQRQ